MAVIGTKVPNGGTVRFAVVQTPLVEWLLRVNCPREAGGRFSPGVWRIAGIGSGLHSLQASVRVLL